jgi:hypothetical protein
VGLRVMLRMVRLVIIFVECTLLLSEFTVKTFLLLVIVIVII